MAPLRRLTHARDGPWMLAVGRARWELSGCPFCELGECVPNHVIEAPYGGDV
jgi:hypothetical protein